MTTILLIATGAIVVVLAAAALWSLRRSRLDHSDLDEPALNWSDLWGIDPDFDGSRTAEIALRVRDRLGPAGDDEAMFAAVLAEVERLVVA